MGRSQKSKKARALASALSPSTSPTSSNPPCSTEVRGVATTTDEKLAGLDARVALNEELLKEFQKLSQQEVCTLRQTVSSMSAQLSSVTAQLTSVTAQNRIMKDAILDLQCSTRGILIPPSTTDQPEAGLDGIRFPHACPLGQKETSPALPRPLAAEHVEEIEELVQHQSSQLKGMDDGLNDQDKAKIKGRCKQRSSIRRKIIKDGKRDVTSKTNYRSLTTITSLYCKTMNYQVTPRRPLESTGSYSVLDQKTVVCLTLSLYCSFIYSVQFLAIPEVNHVSRVYPPLEKQHVNNIPTHGNHVQLSKTGISCLFFFS